MQNKVKLSINRELTLQQREMQARMLALQAQMNPHFLYNTLETINWRAKALKDQQISSMVESLGTLLRATLSNKKPLVPWIMRSAWREAT